MAYAGSVDSDNSDPNYITPKIDGTKPTDVSYDHHNYFSYFFLKLGILHIGIQSEMQAINITDRSTLQYRENEGTIYILVHPSHKKIIFSPIDFEISILAHDTI